MSALQDIPGPTGEDHSALVGSCGGFKEFFDHFHGEYGDIFRFRLNHRNIVCVRSGDMLLNSSPKLINCGDRPRELFEFLGRIFGEDNVQVFDAAQAKQMRVFLAPGLAHARLRTLFPKLWSQTLDLVSQWGNAEGPIECQTQLQHFAMATAVLATLGEAELENFDLKGFYTAYEVALSGAMDEQLRDDHKLEPEAARKLDESISYLHKCIRDIFSRQVEVMKEKGSQRNDFMALVLRNYEGEIAIQILEIFLVAAFHTTISSIAWSLFYIAHHPEVQERLHQEIDSVFDESPSGELSPQSLNRLKFLSRTIKEAMRLQPPGPFAARLLVEDTKLGPYFLPKGTGVFIPISSIHMNTNHWEEAGTFNPDRFASEGSSSIPWYVPFGLGRRLCPGQALAMMEIMLLISVLLRRYDITLAMDVKDVVPVERFVTWAKNGIKITLRLRSVGKKE